MMCFGAAAVIDWNSYAYANQVRNCMVQWDISPELPSRGQHG